MREISLQTRTLYAELLDYMETMDVSRTIANLEGSFAVKEVKGEQYIYFEHYLPGGRRKQVYLGNKTGKAVEKLMKEYVENKADIAEITANVRRLAVQVSAEIELKTDNASMRVMRSLSDAGVFRSGGVIVGTHAFRSMGLMLGVVWPSGSSTTSDIDLAAPRTVTLALPMVAVPIPEAVESLRMGFFQVPALNPKHPSTSFAIRKRQLRLDILTPKTTKSSDPVFIPRFGCAAQPIEHLSYLIESPTHAVLVAANPVLINVPQPARYALHKLIVSQKRDISRGGKSVKDLEQARQILSIIRDGRPYDLGVAWNDLVRRGPQWRSLAERGLEEMGKRFGKIDVDLDELAADSATP